MNLDLHWMILPALLAKKPRTKNRAKPMLYQLSTLFWGEIRTLFRQLSQKKRY
jgi:hypothetical protein